MNPKRKRLILIVAGVAILGGAGAVFAARAKDKPKDGKEVASPSGSERSRPRTSSSPSARSASSSPRRRST